MKLRQLKISTIVMAVVALVIGVGSGAMAAKLITGQDVKNGSLTTKDIKDHTLTSKDIKKASISGDRLKQGAIATKRLKDGAVTSAKIKDGTISANDLSTGAKNSLKTTFAGPNWGIVDRNVIGNGDSFLRAGPTSAFVDPGGQRQTPPMGIGSLGIRTGSGTDKAAFGNQVDFQGMGLDTVTTLGYWAFTTTENINEAPAGVVNLPAVQFEINPNLATHPTDVFSTANFIPPASANLPGWNQIDAIGTGQWFLTGQTGTDVGCDQTTTCTWDELLTNLDDGDGIPPSIFTVQFSKGRDFAYSGAVDALTLNTDVYDFEPFGTTKSAP